MQEASNFTDSPQVEVYGHNINVTRRAIQRRQDTVVARLDEEASRKRKRSSASRVTPAPAPAIPAPTPRAHKPEWDIRAHCPSVNSDIHRRKVVRRALQRPIQEGDGQCTCVSKVCPYSTGPLVMRRFSLLQQLYRVNCELYGPIQATHDMQLMYKM